MIAKVFELSDKGGDLMVPCPRSRAAEDAAIAEAALEVAKQHAMPIYVAVATSRIVHRVATSSGLCDRGSSGSA